MKNVLQIEPVSLIDPVSVSEKEDNFTTNKKPKGNKDIYKYKYKNIEDEEDEDEEDKYKYKYKTSKTEDLTISNSNFKSKSKLKSNIRNDNKINDNNHRVI
jgi:hypothetical protein